MEIIPWSCEMLCVLLHSRSSTVFPHSVFAQRKLKSKKTAAQGFYFEHWKKGGDWTLLLGNEPIVRFSILMHWPSLLPMNCWSIGFLRWLCCPLCIVFCVEFYTRLYVFNRQATVRPWMNSSFGFDSNSVPKVWESI